MHGQAERRRLVGAEREHVERTREREEQRRPRQDQRAAELEVSPAPALEAARQPEQHRLDAELLGRHQQHGGAGAGERGDGEAGEQQAVQRSAARGVGQHVHRQHRHHRPCEGGDGKREEGLPPAELHRQHRSQRGAGADAEQAGVGHRVAEDRLQRGPDDGEAAADERGEEHAGQPHRPQDRLAGGAERGEVGQAEARADGGEHGDGRKRDGAGGGGDGDRERQRRGERDEGETAPPDLGHGREGGTRSGWRAPASHQHASAA